VYSITLLATRV